MVPVLFHISEHTGIQPCRMRIGCRKAYRAFRRSHDKAEIRMLTAPTNSRHSTAALSNRCPRESWSCEMKLRENPVFNGMRPIHLPCCKDFSYWCHMPLSFSLGLVPACLSDLEAYAKQACRLRKLLKPFAGSVGCRPEQSSSLMKKPECWSERLEQYTGVGCHMLSTSSIHVTVSEYYSA